MLTMACSGGDPGSGRLAKLSETGPFTFAAAGDHGANSTTDLGLEALNRSAAEFYLALGDFSYGQTESEEAWCDYIKEGLSAKGAGFPFELVAGNHEQDGSPEGRLTAFTECLPDRLGSTLGPGSVYGAEYTFTYPTRAPLAKFIMISPELTLDSDRYSYEPGSPHRRWLVRQINRARDAGIRWVIVAAHHPCLNTGIRHGCDSGPEILNLLLKKRVDLVLTGHNHLYQRTKQLRRNRSDCRRVLPDAYDADCVVDAGSDGSYTKGRGTVLLTAGSFGRLEPSEDTEDAESGYFVKSSATTTGFAEFTVTRRSITGQFVRTGGTLDDTFEIIGP